MTHESPARLWRPWLLASRPRTLPAAATPVIVATALAARAGAFRPLAALAALCTALLIQIGVNYHNDLYDYKRGTDSPDRVGPTRVTSAGLLRPETVERGIWVVFGLAGACGLYLVYLRGWPVLLLGIAAILSALAYTGGPFPLGYNGLGDVFVFIFFGLVAVLGTYYVQAGTPDVAVVLAAIPMGTLITAILVVNNIRDVDGDRLAGKRTTAVLFGRAGARAEWLLLVAAAYVIPFILWLVWHWAVWILLPLLSVPLAVRLAHLVLSKTGPILNRALAGTAQLVAVYGVLFAVAALL